MNQINEVCNVMKCNGLSRDGLILHCRYLLDEMKPHSKMAGIYSEFNKHCGGNEEATSYDFISIFLSIFPNAKCSYATIRTC